MSDVPAAPAAPVRSGARTRLITALTLLVVSAAMVYGTWLAVDDMRAKPMTAQVTIGHQGELPALEMVNTSDFTWLNVTVTINGTFKTGVELEGPFEPRARLSIPLHTFVDDQDRNLIGAGEPVREVTARATRRSRFPRVNVDRPTSGRWPVD